MANLWFLLLSLLLTGYVVLDGFDLGAGAIHRFVANTDEERRSVIGAIGPFWDGNEVFLIASGGTLFAAFSSVLAAALSGLYLAVFLVLWTLLLRGISIEFRSHLDAPLWRTFWDVVFQLSSGALALLLGVTLGNVLRGFPLEADGYFSMTLFSFESPRLARGLIDGYTLSVGLFALVVLAGHGARFVAMRTSGVVRERCALVAQRTIPVGLALWALVTGLSTVYAPGVVHGAMSRPLSCLLFAAVLGATFLAWQFTRKHSFRAAFAASCALVTALVGLPAACIFPVLLVSTNPNVPSMTIASAANPDRALEAGLTWWFAAALLVALYFANLVRVHRKP